MKRMPSRPGSPTPTAFSGISNYRTDSYRPKDKGPSSAPPIDYRAISRVHFAELSEYLADYLARSPPNSRNAARQKLTRLTVQQFHELSTDVYDELMRRKLDNAPFLPSRDDFHPKRNQARQRLASLAPARFEDLSSDVYYELARRYPEFTENPSGSPISPNEDYNSRMYGSSRMSNRSEERPIDSGYAPSVGRRSTDRRKPSEDISSRRPQDDYSPSVSSRRKPSQDTSRSFAQDRDQFGRRPSNIRHDRADSGSTATAQNPANAATRDVIIPNKSTMEEEYIEVPYGREMPDDEHPDSAPLRSATFSEAQDTASDYLPSPGSPPVGLNGLSARLRVQSDEDDEDDDRPPAGRDNFFGRSSVSSDRSMGRNNGRQSVAEETERIKRDYDFKLASTQSQITDLKRELANAEERRKMAEDSEIRVEQLTEELAAVRRRTEDQSSAMNALQRELDDARDVRMREREREEKRQREAEAELYSLREHVAQLEDERENNMGGGGADAEVVDQLGSDMQGLLVELGDLSSRNDELEASRESDLLALRELEVQMNNYKRKYEQAKTELRSVKVTSQLFSPQPRLDSQDQLPVSSDGGLLDIHVTAFLSAIDGLLTAARSHSPSRVLSPMRLVVNAVSAIIEDAQTFQKWSARDRQDVDLDTLRSLIARTEATLSNLVTASRTHAAGSGMSPVSLLDAAASHVSSTVTDIGKTISIRKASKAEQEQFAGQTPSGSGSVVSSPANGFSSLRSIDEGPPRSKGSPSVEGQGPPRSKGSPSVSSIHFRNVSLASNKSAGRSNSNGGSSAALQSPGSRRRRGPPSDNSSERTNSPPAIFDQPTGVASDESMGGMEGTEDAWAELKPYLEAQTESIVYAIQNVLSDVRTTAPSPKLNENLTQIITIVASIVAVCNDNLPPGGATQGTEILQELGHHANKLSEVQGLDVSSKENRQAIAKNSFAIANAMKTLMKL